MNHISQLCRCGHAKRDPRPQELPHRPPVRLPQRRPRHRKRKISRHDMVRLHSPPFPIAHPIKATTRPRQYYQEP